MVLFPSSRITAKNSTSFSLAVVFLAFEFLIDPFLWAKTQGEKESESEPELEPHNTNANPSKDHLNRFRIICNTFWRLQLPGEGRCAGEEGVPLGQQLQDLLSLLQVPLVVSQKEASKKIIKKKRRIAALGRRVTFNNWKYGFFSNCLFFLLHFLWRQDFADLLEPKVKQKKETKEIKSWQKQINTNSDLHWFGLHISR